MTLSQLRRARVALPSLTLLVACSTGKPGATSDDSGGFANNPGTSPTTGGTSPTGAGGTASNGMGGSSAGGSSALGGSGDSAAMGGMGNTAAVAGTDPGTGGSSAMGGLGGADGTSGGTGGDGASAAVGGTGTGGSGATSGSGGGTGICQDLSVVPTPQVPTVEILVDTSSSMWEMPEAWPVLYNALMVNGVVEALQSKIRFGFASYKGHQGTSETDPACATMTTVDPALDNFDAIKAKYDEVGASYNPASPPSPHWETPTDYAINYASTLLEDYMPDPPGPKYILLVTDGNPNTCVQLDPQCGEDYAIKAAQDAYMAGVGLLVLGVGDIVKNPAAGCPTSARCGSLHLQDLANAGVGAPVQPPTGCDDPTSTSCSYRYESCNAGGVLTATYTPDSPDVGTPYTVDTSATNARDALQVALTDLLNQAVPCTIDMDALVTGDPSVGVVTVDGMPQTYNDPDGWILEANHYSVTLQGQACTAFKSGKELHISFPCDPSGNPVAVHR